MSDIQSELEEYKKAVLHEKFFLQKEGGRKYKASNGKLLNSKNGLSTYSFEMETELYLTDDAPITLTVGTKDSAGSVLICEGFQIVVIVDADFGKTIQQAMIKVEPWKLLESLVEKLDHISANDRIAVKLVQEGPGLAVSAPVSDIPKGQKAAMEATENNSITVIWGPPGTGKTYTMAQIARRELKKGKSILIVSHSNVSVDGVVKQTIAGLRNAGMESLLTEGKVLRYGYVRDEELSKDADAVAYNFVLKQRRDLKEKMEKLLKERDKLKNTGQYNSAQGEEIEKALKELRAAVRNEEKQYAEKAKLLATTISKVTIDSLFDFKKYDVVMFDEVSMAYVPQIICAAAYAREKMILVGDFRQLAPIVQSGPNSILREDIFAFLKISKGNRVYSHPWLVMLNEQRRMHPAISAFPNKYVYSNQLVDHESVKVDRDEIVKGMPLSGNAISLLNLTGTYCAAMKNSDNSRFNILSAIIAFMTAIYAEQYDGNSIGIITPYAAQTRLIRAMIQDYRSSAETEIACSTVHQFQGSERDVILFDAVESYPFSRVGWLMGKDIDSVSRLINVAVTRARGKLVVLANDLFWENRFKGMDHIFFKLLQYIKRSGNEVSVKEKALEAFMESLPVTKNIRLYKDPDEAIEALQKDVEGKCQLIEISVPDGMLENTGQERIMEVVQKAAANGAQVLCKAAGYDDLPEKWQAISVPSENAVFPLIVIDDKVAWYGLPVSRGMFRDGEYGFLTSCQTIFCMRGEHTLEMIKTLTDLEIQVVGGKRQSMQEKRQADSGRSSGYDNSGENRRKNAADETTGLGAFVQRTEVCPQCGCPMAVARSMKGKVFLRCTAASCKEIAYLTPEIVNRYINENKVMCPVHHCGIKAGLSKYGVYVRCTQGHFLKPDEI